MADYRTVKVSMWAQDEWFMDQDTEGKLLWMYLFTIRIRRLLVSTSCPCVPSLLRLASTNQSGYTLPCSIHKDGKAYYEDSTIWVVKMRGRSPGYVKNQGNKTN